MVSRTDPTTTFGGAGRWTRCTRRRALLALTACAVLAPSPAWATHNADDHSDNMKQVANVPGFGGDLAFWGSTAVLTDGYLDTDASNDGFKLLDIANPHDPKTIGRFACVESHYDVSIWKTLVFLSQDIPSESTDCGAQPAPTGGPGTFAGIRVFSIADPAHPRLLAAVPTNCAATATGLTPACPYGSHTHTLLPDLKHRDPNGHLAPRLILYASGANTTIVEVPLRDPAAARVVVNRVDTSPSAGCHDIDILVSKRLAVCAGVNESQLWDVSDPEAPAVLSHIQNPALEHHHSGVFSLDGTTLVLQDEALSSDATTACWAGTLVPKGALWFYDVADPRNPTLIRSYQDPRHVNRTCFAHYADVLPLRDGRDVLTIAWIGAGTRVIDFTDPANPEELGYYIPEPATSCPEPPTCQPVAVSSYWYNGFIYANHGGIFTPSVRGLDVLTTSRSVLDSAAPRSRLNAQTQEGLEEDTTSTE